MDYATKIQTFFVVRLKANISKEAENVFLVLKSLVIEYFPLENPLSDYFNLIESDRNDYLLFNSKKRELDRYIESVNWGDFPEIMEQFELFLETAYLDNTSIQLED